MTTNVAWELGAVTAVVFFAALYVCLQLGAVRNERLINTAITAMLGAMRAEQAPQRALLQAVATTLVAQDRAAARIETTLHALALREPQLALPLPDANDCIKQLLELPEPQQLIADFLVKHAGSPISGTTFRVLSSDLLQVAIADVFADLSEDRLIEFEQLHDLGADGVIAPVAMAVLAAPVLPDVPPFRAPRVADLDVVAIANIAKALDLTTRRQLRLATLLHGQAEALLRIDRRERRALDRLRSRARQILRMPLVRHPQFSRADLETLEVAFDAVGEVVDTAEKKLAGGDPVRAMELLAGLRIPVPAGLPGRMYHLESLAQAQPAALFGVWHRLAMSRWLSAAIAAVSAGAARTYWLGESTGLSEHHVRDAELELKCHGAIADETTTK